MCYLLSSKVSHIKWTSGLFFVKTELQVLQSSQSLGKISNIYILHVCVFVFLFFLILKKNFNKQKQKEDRLKVLN